MKFATTQHQKICASNLNTKMMNLKCTHECTFTMKKNNSIVSNLCCVASTATNAATAAAEQSCCCSFHFIQYSYVCMYCVLQLHTIKYTISTTLTIVARVVIYCVLFSTISTDNQSWISDNRNHRKKKFYQRKQSSHSTT